MLDKTSLIATLHETADATECRAIKRSQSYTNHHHIGAIVENAIDKALTQALCELAKRIAVKTP